MPLPLIAGSHAIARRIVRGASSVVMPGDSTVGGGYDQAVASALRWWLPEKGWDGYGCEVNAQYYHWGGAAYNPANGGAALCSNAAYNGSNGPGGATGFCALRSTASNTRIHAFNAVAAIAEPNIYDQRLVEFQLSIDGGQFGATSALSWYNGKALKCGVLYWAHATGLQSFFTRLRSGTTALGSATGLSARSATPEHRSAWFDSTPHTFSAFPPNLGVFPTAGTTPAAGDTLVTLAAAFHTGESGMRLFPFVAYAGSRLDEWKSAVWPAAACKAYLDFVACTDVVTWLGANDAGTSNKSAFKGHCNDFIDHVTGARPGVGVTLVAPWQQSTATATAVESSDLSKYAEAMYEVAMSRPNVAFINLNQMCMWGGRRTPADVYAGLSAQSSGGVKRFLSDTVHQNTHGDVVVAKSVWSGWQLLDAQAPSVTISAGNFRRAF